MDDDLRRAHADLDASHWWFRGRQRVIATVLDRFVAQPASRGLDVGCGAGAMLDVVVPRVSSLMAIEGDRHLAALARSRHPGVEVATGTIPAALDGLPTFRLITAFDVIEHLDDDTGTLARLCERLDRDGLLCLTVPALPALWSEHDEANGHRRRYTATTLERCIRAAGLDLVHISYFNTFLLPAIAVARLLGKLRRSHARTSDFDRSLGPVDHVLEQIFAAERRVVARWRVPIGVSLIAVCCPAPGRER